MALTLYSNYVNSAGERVRIAMGLKGIEYDYISVSQIGRAAYKKINPQGLVPALRIDGQIIPQATAILEWLEEAYPAPALLPPDPIVRAQARGFAQAITSEMHAIDVIRVRRFLADELDLDQPRIDRWQHHWFHAGFTALEALLARRQRAWRCCFSDGPGWADRAARTARSASPSNRCWSCRGWRRVWWSRVRTAMCPWPHFVTR
ncbi:MAG: glutathione S-transferase N-terminal domain-containing protein, partial [Pseudomonadota bacterium]